MKTLMLWLSRFMTYTVVLRGRNGGLANDKKIQKSKTKQNTKFIAAAAQSWTLVDMESRMP